MDLELSDEQVWLSESVTTLLERAWPPPEAVATAKDEQRRRVWDRLVEFGALTIGAEDGLGAAELCLIARALGTRLVSVPFLGSAAVRMAVAPFLERMSDEVNDALAGGVGVSLAQLEPGSSSWFDAPATEARRTGEGLELHGEKVAVEHVEAADWLAVVASLDGQPTLAVLPTSATGVIRETRRSFDETIPLASLRFDGAQLSQRDALAPALGDRALERLGTIGALLAAAEAVGAAGAVLELAVRYAAERKQFGRAIGTFQALRHLLADMYVRHSSGWSTVLYAAASLDDDADDAARNASVAKAYVSRSAREIAHGALQAFGGIAFTAEHPAHRFLRRIVVRERQFGDAAHHERILGAQLATRAGAVPRALAEASLP
ncbi:MAG: hypothetical protein JO130_02495 [Solirubrobacterales bacterium]|nr:hypothetical protein [Solirubrobacterales bacterium]